MDIRRPLVLTLAFLGVAPACGDSSTTTADDEPADRGLCDGSQDLRLAWIRGGGGTIQAEIEREVGFYYLYVRGDCRYWALTYRKPPEFPVFQTHTGVLTAEAEAAIAELVRYGEWDGLTGFWDEEGAFDVTGTRVHDGTRTIVCRGDCPGAPEPVIDMARHADETFHELWEAGEPLADDAPMRVVSRNLGPNTPEAFYEVVPWTVNLDLATVAVSYEQLMTSGMSTLVDDPTVTAALREFRAQHAQIVSLFDDVLVVETQSGDFYNVHMRDALPFEDEQGLVPTPPPG